MKIPSKALGIAASFLVFCATVQAGTVFSTTLSASSEADPTNESTGTGSATFIHDSATHMLTLSVLFSGLTGLTTVSHIHAVTALAFSGNAGVATQTPSFALFPAGVQSGSYDNTFDLTLASSYNAAFLNNAINGGSTAMAEATLISAMWDGHAYLNVHTDYKPGGEIRGYISQVPDASATGWLCVPALLALFGLARHRRALSA